MNEIKKSPDCLAARGFQRKRDTYQRKVIDDVSNISRTTGSQE